MGDDVKLLCSSKETTINNHVDDKNLEPRFECPICLSWLHDPLLTSCGHKFCSKCIHKWLKNDGARCPIDNRPLEQEKDLFRDLHTSREISEQRVNCPYQLFGCTMQLSPIDMQSHVARCLHKKHAISDEQQQLEQIDNVICHVDDSVKNDYQSVIKPAVKTEGDKSDTNSNCVKKSKNLEMFSKTGENDFENTDWQKLLKNLFERIVTLEQLNRELTITVQNQQTTIASLQDQLQTTQDQLTAKTCQGFYIWRFKFFNERLAEMRSDPLKMFYSSGFYTNPNGYKLCIRANISSKDRNFLSLVMHIMRSENDGALDWPFNGMISFILIHPIDLSKSICEKTLSRPDLEAFKRPTGEFNKRSFGYTEFVSIQDLPEFVNDNTLMFRVEIRPIGSSCMNQ